MVLSAKMMEFFLFRFLKGPQFKDKLLFFNLKCPFFLQNSSKSVKKMIQRQKNGCHSSFIGHLTPKTLAKQHAKTKNTFWGQFPTLSTKTSSSFFMLCDKSTEKYFKRKKCGCTLSKNGYLTSVRPPKHHFDQKSHKEDFCLARFYQRKTLGVSKSNL